MVKDESPQTIARWLRRCVEDPRVADQCYGCPFARHAMLDPNKNCMDELHYAAAELIEQQNNIKPENR